MSHPATYTAQVKEAVADLITLTTECKFYSLSLDTDEDCPFVNLWYYGQAIKVSGVPTEGWICPDRNDADYESWCFLTCCQRALEESKKYKPTTRTKE